MAHCVDALKGWTSKRRVKTLFDSTVDEFTGDGLFDKVQGKPNIAIVGFTTDGDVFGGFYSVAVTKQEEDFYDLNIFAFSFESHGRCATPQRFFTKEELKRKALVEFVKSDDSGFVVFWVEGAGGFWLGNERSDSFCCDMSLGFEGLDDTTLTGQTNTDWKNPPYHHCARLVALQLE